MWTENKAIKVTRNGVVEDVNVTMTFEKPDELTPPFYVQMNMASDKLKFHASVNFNVANKDISFHVSDIQFIQTVIDITKDIVDSVSSEFQN